MKLNLRSVRSKISLGFGLILLVVLMLSLGIVIGINRINNVNAQLATGFGATENQILSLNAAMKESMTLSKNWIYQPAPAEKTRLINFIAQDSKKLMNQFAQAKSQVAEDKKEGLIDTIFVAIIQCVTAEKEITRTLKTPEDYNNDSLVDASISSLKVLEEKFTIYTAQVNLLSNYLKEKTDRLDSLKSERVTSLVHSLYITIAVAIVACSIIGLIILQVLNRTVSRPIQVILKSLGEIEEGKIVEMQRIEANDEVARINNSLVKVVDSLTGKASFANEIGKGNLDIEYTPLSELDVLGNALLAMRSSLKSSAEEEAKRSWAVTGLAKFGDILRNQDQDLARFGDQVLSFTIKYSNINQGRLYLVNDDDSENPYLQMISCYAWEKKRFVEERIEKGQGLTGQCWQEGSPIYLTKVPENYIKITSGLGLATPRNIFIVPLRVNDEIFGVMELASFSILKVHERDFILKLSESLGSALSTVRINHKTKTLLAHTQQQAEEMRSQEEEMRQNMEELSATQEEMSRKEREYVQRIAMLEERAGQLIS